MTLQEASEDYGLEIDLGEYPTPKDFPADEFRSTLNQKIIDHYWMREIGHETFSIWRGRAKRKMREIMPYYNKLYESELIAFDPLSTMDMTSTSNSEQSGTSEGTGTSEGNNDTESTSYYSDYPQTSIVNNQTGNYAANGQNSKGTGNNSGSTSENRTDNATAESTANTKGYAGVASDLLTAYRGTLLNIDMLVIGQFEELFMQVFSSGDTFTGGY